MTKLKIKPVNHGKDKNRYCGPSVISAITGMQTGEAARLIRHVGGRSAVRGTSSTEIIRALDACGIRIKRREFGLKLHRTNGVTLAGWLKATVKERTADRVFLLVAGWHWQLVQGRRYVCGITKEVVSIKHEKVKRRARVAEVYELFADGKVTIPPEARKPKAKENYESKVARALAKKLDIEITCERDAYGRTYWIECSDKISEQIDGRFCTSWVEVYDKLHAIEQINLGRHAA